MVVAVIIIIIITHLCGILHIVQANVTCIAACRRLVAGCEGAVCEQLLCDRLHKEATAYQKEESYSRGPDRPVT